MNKKIRFGVAGVHSFGKHHIQGIQKNEDAELVMICDTDAQLAAQVAAENGVPYTTDFEEMVKNPDVDAVCIVTPDPTHKDLVLKALAAGKHILCEKPMTLKLSESKEIVKAAENSKSFMMVGQICRFTPSFMKAKELVEQGEIGELFFVEGEYAHDYSGMIESTPWRFDSANPRHGMIGGGCHSVDLLRWIAGNPTEAVAYSNKKVLVSTPTDDCTIAILKFPNNVIGKVFCSTGCKRPYTMRTVLYGTEGTIIVDNRSQHMSIYKTDILGSDRLMGFTPKGIELKIPMSINDHNIGDEIKEFVQCIKEGKKPLLSAREGAITVSVCDAIIRSAEEHKIIEVDYNF